MKWAFWEARIGFLELLKLKVVTGCPPSYNIGAVNGGR